MGWMSSVLVVGGEGTRLPKGFSQSLRWKGVKFASLGLSFFCSWRDRSSSTTGSSNGGSGSTFCPSRLLRKVRRSRCCVGSSSLPLKGATWVASIWRSVVEMPLAWLQRDARRRIHWPGISGETRVRRCRKEVEQLRAAGALEPRELVWSLGGLHGAPAALRWRASRHTPWQHYYGEHGGQLT